MFALGDLQMTCVIPELLDTRVKFVDQQNECIDVNNPQYVYCMDCKFTITAAYLYNTWILSQMHRSRGGKTDSDKLFTLKGFFFFAKLH